MQRQYLPHIQVRNNCIVVYDMPDLAYNHARNLEGFKKAYSGKVVQGTQKRIRKAIDILLQTTPERVIFNPVIQVHHPFRLSFITLTIATEKAVDAKTAHAKLLRPWLDWATKTKGAKDYIWKAELQERGQLHYHITTDTFLHYSEIRNKWNNLQRREGLLNAFAKKHGHFDPNSTDVHSVRQVRDFEAYLAKYIAKNEQNGKELNGKVWDCSMGLKRDRFSWELDTRTLQNLEFEVEVKRAEKVALENCTIFKLKNPENALSDALYDMYQDWLQGIPPPPPPPPPSPPPPPPPPPPRPVQGRIEF